MSRTNLKLVESSADLKTPEGRLRYARAKAGFSSARAFADALDMPYSSYASQENGGVGIAPEAALRYAERLKVKASWLLFGEGDDPKDDVPPAFKALAERIDRLEAKLDTLLAHLGADKSPRV